MARVPEWKRKQIEQARSAREKRRVMTHAVGVADRLLALATESRAFTLAEVSVLGNVRYQLSRVINGVVPRGLR